jgi:tetratricopeptide (TPR) repeat protein
LRLRLTLQGEGNIRSAQDPTLSLDPSMRLQPEGRSEQITHEDSWVRGVRTYDYLLVSRRPGTLALGQARVRYFDPQAQAWLTAATVLPSIQVQPRPLPAVVPQGAEVSLGASRALLGLRPIHGGRDELRRLDRPAVASLRFWLVPVLGLVLLGLALLLKRWQRLVEADPAATRARRALALARSALHEAQGHARKGAVTRFYDCLARTATDYLAAKFNISAAYIVSERLGEYFDRHQIPALYRTRFKTTLMACEYVRFAAVELPSHDMRSLLRDLALGIEDFERYWRRRGGLGRGSGVGTATLLLLAVLAAGLTHAGEPELFFLHGNSAFEQGQYETALAEYQRVITLGSGDPDVYYNLGNTYLKLGQVGRSILAYENGLRLAPRDTDLRHNLAQAAAIAIDAQPEESVVSYRGWVTQAYRTFTANELAWAASACYGILVLSLILWLLAPSRAAWWRRLALAGGVLLALVTGWCVARYLENRWWQRAVVLTTTADILGRPYADAEKMYVLHEGTRVSVAREEEAWVEVRFGQDRHGWIARGALGMIE